LRFQKSKSKFQKIKIHNPEGYNFYFPKFSVTEVKEFEVGKWD
jgi:hypothetical protein